ncbi:MAG TPA: hypothetical protein VN738_09845, partial [Acidothermaceae bacterium]|nr:hypothetical protein [Acidothermaceae bacterium]
MTAPSIAEPGGESILEPAPNLAGRPQGPVKRLWQQVKQAQGFSKWLLWVGAAITLVFIVLAVFAPLIAPYDPREQDLLQIALHGGCCPGPSRAHWFGLDNLGR